VYFLSIDIDMCHFSLLVQRKVTKRKHTPPSRPLHYVQRVRFASGTFRRNIHVAAKSDGHRARRPLGVSRWLHRYGRGQKAKASTPALAKKSNSPKVKALI